jgi:hypothetical protein
MQSELRLATSKVWKDYLLVGAISLIYYSAQACFIQGLSSDRIQTSVRSRSEQLLVSSAMELALEEESALLSAKDRGLGAQMSKRNKDVMIIVQDQNTICPGTELM